MYNQRGTITNVRVNLYYLLTNTSVLFLVDNPKRWFDVFRFAKTYFMRNRKFIGGTYKKAVFVEYTDKSFKVQKPRKEDEEHLALLGPPIRAEVGDVIHVYFLNRATRGYSVHPQGVHFDKNNEGMLYNDNNPGRYFTLP